MDSPEAVELKKRFGKLTVSELKQELAKVGVERNGVKAVLVERLAMWYASRNVEQAGNGDGGDGGDGGGESGAGEAVPVGEDTLRAKDEGASVGQDGDQVEVELEGNADVEEVGGEVEMNEVDGDVDEGVEGMDEVVDEGVEVEGEGDEENQGGENEQGEEGNEENVRGEEVEENDEDVDKGIELGENVTGQELEDEGSNQESSNGKDGDQDELQDQDQSENKETSHDSEIGNDEGARDNKVAEDENEEKGKEAERHIMLITGLTSETTANDLKTFFRKHGKIGRIRIMTNTRVPGSQRFAHITVSTVDELDHFVQTVNGVKLKGKVIRVQKAPDDGSVSSSYEVAVATAAKDEEEEKAKKEKGEKGGDQTENGSSSAEKEGEKEVSKSGEVQMVEGTKAEGKKEKKEEKDQKQDKKTSEKPRRERTSGPQHRSRKESHERRRAEEGYRPARDYRRENARSSEWRRHNQLPSRSQVEITRVQRDRPPMGRGHPVPGPRRRSPHAQLTFEQIREIRDEQRRREYERRKREEERERAADVEKQKRLEYQNYMEFKQLEREREKLRMERERIEREKLELIKLERERQKAEREKIEKEKEELRRAKYEYSYQRPAGVKRPYEEDKRRIEAEPSKKIYTGERHADLKSDGGKLDRYSDSRLYSSHSSKEGRSRSPIARDPRRDPWGKGIEVRPKTHTDDRSHRRELDSLKSDRRREDSRSMPGSSELASRYAAEASSSRGLAPAKRYDDGRSSTRETEWLTRSSYLGPSSSLSLPLSSTSAASRESWPIAERKLEAWDTSRLAPRAEPWISGGTTAVASAGRSSLPVQAPPPPIYSHTAGLPLASSSLTLGRYGADRYEAYKASSYLNRFQ